jgi:hypothetical protein
MTINGRKPSILLVAVVALAAFTPAASGHASSFSGSCKLTGPITPLPPITIVPRPGPHFDYLGAGACHGKLDGAAVTAAPAALAFDHASTLFDTCELGPDFPLRGSMTIGGDRFAVTIDLLRAALAGPFAISTAGGGLGVGVASFNPGSPIVALSECVKGGVATASLAANFSTLRPLIGT